MSAGAWRKARWPRAVRARLGVLSVFIALQAVAVAFFIGDVVVDIMVDSMSGSLVQHTVIEAIATLALLMGVSLGAYEIWQTLARTRRAERALQLASGAFSDLVRQRFDFWGLTDAEREVALLTLKGFDAPEIGRLRQVANGTVRAQLARIYAKSESNGRGQFVSLFLDDLLETPLQEAR
ncbi:helix-turn-helix transcriptional regulator [Antarcticimicrobium sediminis]|uniref:LuxR family transcriptional regulator n=1 Tax=Antarcticimicrobium sediminis TaxID=2546227 RepID=A0A4R5EKW9_9RHOB|nr:LuxR family transcriptional regulator [Antarcticimicrobium sediminis]TDE35077.1 LuxR family transcriptional regulator [Antarcticimicrobium sediminis]